MNSKSFWDGYSGQCNIVSMMLNHNAEILDELDRKDILASIPSVEQMTVLDLGAGIGRYTTIFAEKAKLVITADFIESFIEQSKARNANFTNIKYKVIDAAHLDLQPKSIDFVFTNWLLMYLSDHEMIEFLLKLIKWLNPNGYFHLRESCSQPSTKKREGILNTNDYNPATYRYSSVYIRLLNSIRYKDDDGTWYRFEVLWSCSVSTYILKESNWRQVHWLIKKVPTVAESSPTVNALLHHVSTTWVDEQNNCDRLMLSRNCWANEVIEKILCDDQSYAAESVFIYNPRNVAYHFYLDANNIAETFDCHVWNVEKDALFYRTMLTRANEIKDHRVRVTWNDGLRSALEYCEEKNARFDMILLCGILDDEIALIKHLKAILNANGCILLLSPVKFHNVPIDQELLYYENVQRIDANMFCFSAISNCDLDKKQKEEILADTWMMLKMQQ